MMTTTHSCQFLLAAARYSFVPQPVLLSQETVIQLIFQI